jgi:hypothetical protein
VISAALCYFHSFVPLFILPVQPHQLNEPGDAASRRGTEKVIERVYGDVFLRVGD